MDDRILLLIAGLLYTLLFGGLSLLRREGLSLRFALESVLLTLAATLLRAAGVPISPIVFLLLLYLITMRVRILVDAGNWLARSGRQAAAERAYATALALFPDDTGRLIVTLNQGVLRLQQRRLDEALALLRGVLAAPNRGFLGLKHECGCHYNLGVTYRRLGREPQALAEFQAVLDTWPASEYARHAAAAIRQGPGVV